jgi:ornithine carbamoyltransferase
MHAPAPTVVQNLRHRSLAEFAAMSEPEATALVALARSLHAASLAGLAPGALRGKNLAVLCDTAGADDDAPALFRRAAVRLGARVARLRPSVSILGMPRDLQHTAALLGRLYDALDCIGMPAELVRELGAAAGVPVFEAASSSRHPTARLAERLRDDSTLDDARCAVMQAVLVSALA